MSIISLRMNKEEEHLIKEYAKLNNITVSELFRTSVLARIENDIDLKLYREAIKEHRYNPSDISFNDMLRELDLDV